MEAQPKTILRVQELVDALAAKRFNEGKAGKDADAFSFFQKVTGTTDADALEAIKKEPFVWIVAILCYLGERRYPERAETTVQHETKKVKQ